MDGFCKVEAKASGPVQLKLLPTSVLPVKFRSAPTQADELTPLIEAVGVGSMVTITLVVQLSPQPSLTVSEKV